MGITIQLIPNETITAPITIGNRDPQTKDLADRMVSHLAQTLLDFLKDLPQRADFREVNAEVPPEVHSDQFPTELWKDQTDAFLAACLRDTESLLPGVTAERIRREKISDAFRIAIQQLPKSRG